MITQESQGIPRQTPAALTLAGAGRSSDWQFPNYVGDMSSHVGLPTPIASRITGATPYNVNATNSGGVGASSVVFVAGQPFIQLSTGVVNVSGAIISSINAMVPHFPIVKGKNACPASCDDFAVWRTFAIMAFDVIPSVDCDYGFEHIFPATDAVFTLIKEGQQGFGWLRTADGRATLYINGPQGIVRFALPAAFDPTIFHTYEFQFFSATMTTEAIMVAVVDGVIFQTLSWGAGTVLPSPITAYRQAKPVLAALCGGVGHLNVYRWCIVSGPTLQSVVD